MTDHTGCGLPEGDSTRLGGEHWEDGVTAALRRAAKQAHLIAYQTGTGVVEQRNGKMGVYAPDPQMYEDLIPAPFVESSEA
ncbi:MAG: hypothetical protein OXL98_02350 [Acidimicrobiaceae bacterium]|nr:hypothetical protein [Acidimicrobiaceae bacterium]